MPPVIAGLAKVMVETVPVTATGWFTYNPVVAVQENVPLVPVTATPLSVSEPSAPPGVTVWPMYKPLVEVHENVPLVPVTVTPDKIVDAKLEDTMVVLAGIPVPVTVCPAPIR